MNLRRLTPDELQLSQLTFEPYVFFLPAVLKQQSPEAKIIQLEQDQQVLVQLPFYPNAYMLSSPLRAPFGGLIGSPQATVKDYAVVLQEWINYADSLSVKELKITQWPQSYASQQAEHIHQALLSSGFKVTVEEVNQELSITGEDFTSRLHDSEKRRLQKSLRSGFRVEVGAFHHIDEYHALVQRNRIHKGHPLTISAEGLKQVLKDSPHHVFFAVYDQDKMIAAATGVRISSKILYYYLPGSEPDYAAHSPMVLLLQAMYEYAQSEGMNLLDLGISTAGGVMNEGLFRFKAHLGATSSLKLTYTRG